MAEGNFAKKVKNAILDYSKVFNDYSIWLSKKVKKEPDYRKFSEEEKDKFFDGDGKINSENEEG